MNIRCNLVISMCAMLALCGCGARKYAARGTGVAAQSPSEGVFAPAQLVAWPAVGPGSRYNDLLSPDSYAIWFTDEVARIKAESGIADGATEAKVGELVSIAKQLNEKYLIFECNIVSAFPDASVAYDITAFRHADILLLNGGGTKCAPLQVIIGSLEREADEALKKFRRVNFAIFPRHDLLTGEPVVGSQTPGFSLIVSAYKTDYLFSWSTAGSSPRQAVSDEEMQALRATSLQSIESVLRFLVENL